MSILINSRDNPKIKYAVKLGKDAGERRRRGMFLVPGSKAVADTFARGYEPVDIFAGETAAVKYADRLRSLDVITVSGRRADKLSEGKTDDGVWGVFRMKSRDYNTLFDSKRVLALCDIQDPGNMGAVMRTALAMGYESVVVSEGCADIYSRKVIRSSMTACLKLKVYRSGDMVKTAGDLSAAGFATMAACLEGAENLGSFEIPGRHAIFIGSEGQGLSDDVISRCTHRVKIPQSSRIESLNAAVSRGILMWEATRDERI